jgi:hypothetical protein
VFGLALFVVFAVTLVAGSTSNPLNSEDIIKEPDRRWMSNQMVVKFLAKDYLHIGRKFMIESIPIYVSTVILLLIILMKF